MNAIMLCVVCEWNQNIWAECEGWQAGKCHFRQNWTWLGWIGNL